MTGGNRDLRVRLTAHGSWLTGRGAYRWLAALLLVSLAAASCGGSGDAAGEPAAPDAPAMREGAPSEPASADDHARFQRLNAETLQLMIEAAQKEMEIGPFQTRISAATMQSMSSMKDATDEMEQVVADLKDALGK